MRKNCQGMTLIEVLVAFVVLSLAMAVIMQIFTGGMRNARLADSYTRAVFLAETKMAAVGVEQALVPGEVNGQLGADLRWRVMVQPYDNGAPVEAVPMRARLYQVRVQVNWSDDQRPRQIELASLRLGSQP